jgi:hypothetical protein
MMKAEMRRRKIQGQPGQEVRPYLNNIQCIKELKEWFKW